MWSPRQPRKNYAPRWINIPCANRPVTRQTGARRNAVRPGFAVGGLFSELVNRIRSTVSLALPWYKLHGVSAHSAIVGTPCHQAILFLSTDHQCGTQRVALP